MIHIDKNFHIVADTYQWILKYESDPVTIVNPETKEERTGTRTDKWFFPTLEMCLNKYLDVVSKGAESVSELLSLINDAKTSIENLDLSNVTVFNSKIEQ